MEKSAADKGGYPFPGSLLSRCFNAPPVWLAVNGSCQRLSGKGDRHPISCTSLRRGPLHPGASPRFRTASQ